MQRKKLPLLKISHVLLAMIVMLGMSLAAQSVKAQPNNTVNYLQNKPVSSFAFGIYVLGTTIHSYASNAFSPGTNVTFSGAGYDPDQNAIFIRLLVNETLRTSANEARERCVSYINRVKEYGGLVQVGARYRLPRSAPYSKYASYFLTPDYFEQDSYDGLTDESYVQVGRDIDRLITITVGYTYTPVDATSLQQLNRLHCTSALIGDDVNYLVSVR